jgi:replicative DNA helicase
MKTNNSVNIDLSDEQAVAALHQTYTLGDTRAEESLIAAILNKPELIEAINEILDYSMFFNPINKLLFRSIIELKNENREINEITLMEKSKVNKDFITSFRLGKILIANVPTLSLRVISSYSTEEIKRIMSNPNFDMTIDREEIDSILQLELRAKDSSETTAVYQLSEIIEKEVSQVFEKTGIQPIDSKLGGIAQCGLIVVAGRPKTGKTSFMTTMCLKSSLTSKVAYLTIEMTAQQIVNKIKYMNVKGKEVGNIQIVDYPLPNLNKIIVTISQLAREGVKIFYLDYLQLIKTKYSGTNEVASLSTITLELKLLAKRLNIVIVTGSQLSRGIELREDKRPLMSDLKGSGSIEQDSDTIFALHRDNPDSALEATGSKVSIYILANRHGASGVINDLRMFPSGEFREQTQDEILSSIKTTPKSIAK